MSSERKLTKTLTFSLGRVQGYLPREKATADLEDTLRKKAYSAMRELSEGLAQACNVQTAMEYVRRILTVPEEQKKIFSHASNPWIRNRIEKAEHMSGTVLNQAWMLGVKPEFSGEHGRDLLQLGKKRLPIHRTDGTHPIYSAAQGARLFSSGKQRYLAVSLFSREWAKEQGFPSGWLAFPLKVKPRDKTQLEQLGRILSGEWKQKNVRILRSRRQSGARWIGQVTVEYTPEPFKDLEPSTVMGVDLGLVAPACLHIRRNGEPEKWQMMVGKSHEMLQVRQAITYDIKRIVKALRSKDSPLDSATRERLKEKLRDLRHREKRVMKTASRRIAATIAETARRHGAGIWQLEDLSACKEGKPWLVRHWAPGMVLDAIRWQAEQLDAKLDLINPAYTSLRCSECGHIDAANRPKQADFKCTVCGYQNNADKNAARNLSVIGIAQIIEDTLKDVKVPNGTA